MPEFSLVPKSYSLFPYFCSAIKLNPYLPFEFLNFFIILVCLFFIHAKHSGAQNVTGAYIIITLVYRRLLTTRLHGKAAV